MYYLLHCIQLSDHAVTARQQANVAAKRARGGSSSDEFVRGSEDELDLDSEEEQRRQPSDSELSDFNPFHGGSDSDDGEPGSLGTCGGAL